MPGRNGGYEAVELPAGPAWRIDVNDERKERSSRLYLLEGVSRPEAARIAEELHADLDGPVLTADNCLFKRVQAAKGLARLQYCTVLTTTIAAAAQHGSEGPQQPLKEAAQEHSASADKQEPAARRAA